MKKIYRAFALLLSLCAAIGVFALSACGDEKDETATYTVTLTCENALVFGGLNVRMTAEDGTVAAEKSAAATVTFSLKKGTYKADLSFKKGFDETLLENYTYAPATLTAEKLSATIAIVPAEEAPKTIAYTVKVLKPDGTPAADVGVQLCGGPENAYACHDGKTDASGVASFELPAGNYDVHIDAPPTGFAFNNNAYKMTDKGGTLEVSLTAAE